MMEGRHRDATFIAFQRECSVRRTSRLLEAKRKRIREDLQDLVRHLGLLVPAVGLEMNASQKEVLAEALGRLEDDTFAQLVLQITQELQ